MFPIVFIESPEGNLKSGVASQTTPSLVKNSAEPLNDSMDDVN